MRSLVVNADDYGLTTGVSRAILRAHTDGVVTSPSVLTVAPAFVSTVGWLDDAPGLGVGLHLAAVGEDPPLLTAAEIPTLVDRKGNFTLSSLRMVPRLALARVDPADLRREFTAQFEAFTGAGLVATHVDTHHNLHLWPMVGEVVASLARDWSVPAVRVPWSCARSPLGAGIRRFSRTLSAQVDASGRWHPDAYFGLDEGGQLDTPTLLALIDEIGALPDAHRCVEIAVHPGEPGDTDLERYPWPGASREAELESLTSPDVRRRIADLGYELTPHGHLCGSARPERSARPTPRPVPPSRPRP